MLRIKYNNDFLDLAANNDQELEANSPMFLMDNLLAEYSTPISIVYTDKNARLIGPLFFSLSVKKKVKLPVEIYKGNAYRATGTLIIESAAIKGNTRNNSASGYLLTGISSFFAQIKDVLCTDLNIGSYSGTYTTSTPEDNTNGYWQDFQKSWLGNMDWICAPIRNDNLYNNPGNSAWMNAIGRIDLNIPERTWGQTGDPFGGYYNGNYNNTNGNNTHNYTNYNVLQAPLTPVFPQLFLHVAFTNIFKSVGWTLDSSLIDDFSKLVVFSNFKVDTYSWTTRNNPQPLVKGPYPTVTFNYADLLPKNVKASTFILAICKRYGWVPLTNTAAKTCKLFPLKLVESGTVKDWTKYAANQHDSEFSEEDKIYSFKNNFTGNDAYTSEPDISGLEQTLVVDSKFTLPAAADIYDNSAVFCCRENAWYGIIVNENNARAWAPLKDNIFNDENEQANTTFETDCTTMAITWSNYTADYWGLFPYCSQPFNLEGGIRTLFYHGLQKERNANGSEGQTTYPYLSSIQKLPDGTNALTWSNVFKYLNADGTESGIEKYWFEAWLKYMKYAEQKTQVLNLPLHELVNYNWNDIILINNIPHLIISYIEKLSQQNFIQAKLLRLYIDQ